MCLGNEGVPYGHLADKTGPLTVQYMASRCVVTSGLLLKSIAQLVEYKRIEKTGDGVIFIPRMVEDEAERLRKSEAGGKGGNPNIVKREVNHTVNQDFQNGLPNSLPASPARARADSDVVVSFSYKGVQGENLIDAREFPKTCKEIALKHPTTGIPMMSSIIHAAMQAYVSVDNPKIQPPNDWDIAEAVRIATKAATNQTSAALYKSTVAAIIGNWAKFGKASGDKSKYWDPKEVTG
jgi:hypothetical protein